MTGLRAAVLFCMISACLGCNAIYPVKDAAELKSNLKCECGVRNGKATRIAGGTDASKHEFPWQVGLSKTYGGFTLCGGSIISSKTILTAAHCLENVTTLWAVIGEHDLKMYNGDEFWIQICNKTIHPNYDELQKKNDFAILTLCSPYEIDFTEEISPICLPPTESPEGGSQYENIDAIVSGWGRFSINGTKPNILQKTEVKTMTNKQCCTKPNLRNCDQIKKSMLCGSWTGEAGTTGACIGDSGGPLITKGSYGYSQIGVVSFGPAPCGSINYPDVYARVTKAQKWIISNTEGTICNRPGLPVQCTDYRILDESDRRGKSYSDYTSDNYPRNLTDALSIPLGFEKSPNWRGYAWYRFQNPNYHRMATQKTDHGGCGSAHEIWMHTKHPTTIGTTIKAAFCHEETDIQGHVPFEFDRCWRAGKVTNCGDYYVYLIRDTVIAGGRYCAE